MAPASSLPPEEYEAFRSFVLTTFPDGWPPVEGLAPRTFAMAANAAISCCHALGWTSLTSENIEEAALYRVLTRYGSDEWTAASRMVRNLPRAPIADSASFAWDDPTGEGWNTTAWAPLPRRGAQPSTIELLNGWCERALAAYEAAKSEPVGQARLRRELKQLPNGRWVPMDEKGRRIPYKEFPKRYGASRTVVAEWLAKLRKNVRP